MKPKIYAYDYLGRRYADLSSIADITIAHEIPQSLKGYEGVILHSEFPSNLKYLVDEIKKKIHVFFHTMHEESSKETGKDPVFTKIHSELCSIVFGDMTKLAEKIMEVYNINM